MDSYTPPPYRPLPDPYPERPRVALTVWNALWPPVLYIAMQYAVAIIGGVLINVSLTLSNDLSMMSYEEIEALTYDAIYRWAMPFTAISMVLSLAVFIPFYFRFHRGQEKRIGQPVLGFGNIFLILALTVTSYLFIISVISFLPQSLGNDYEEHMKTLTTGSFAWQLLVVGVGAPVVEELCMRGLTQDRLLKIMSPAPAIFIQAAIFGIIHFDIVQSSYAFLLGLLLGWLCWRSRSLWASFLCHFFMNTGNILLGEFLDSGEDIVEDIASDPVGNEYVGVLVILLFALACSAALIYALNKTLPGRKKQTIEATPWEM